MVVVAFLAAPRSSSSESDDDDSPNKSSAVALMVGCTCGVDGVQLLVKVEDYCRDAPDDGWPGDTIMWPVPADGGRFAAATATERLTGSTRS